MPEEQKDKNQDGSQNAASQYLAIVLAAFLPVLGYAMAFVYEYGMAHRYGLPVGLIRVDVKAGLLATRTAYMVMPLWLGTVAVVACTPRQTREEVLCFCFVMTQLIILVAYGVEELKYWSWFHSARSLEFILVPLGLYGLYLWLARKPSSPSKIRRILDKTNELVWASRMMVVCLGFLALWLSGLWVATEAMDEAANREVYPVMALKSGKSMLVLRIYGNTAICAPVVYHSTEVTAIKRRFCVVQLNDSSERTLKIMKTGRVIPGAVEEPKGDCP